MDERGQRSGLRQGLDQPLQLGTALAQDERVDLIERGRLEEPPQHAVARAAAVLAQPARGQEAEQHERQQREQQQRLAQQLALEAVAQHLLIEHRQELERRSAVRRVEQARALVLVALALRSQVDHRAEAVRVDQLVDHGSAGICWRGRSQQPVVCNHSAIPQRRSTQIPAVRQWDDERLSDGDTGNCCSNDP